MKKISTLLLLLLVCVAAGAQTASQYVFSRTTSTYTSIESAPGAIASYAISGDDAGMQNIPIGFNFIFCGTSYSQLSANSNGWLSLANSSTTSGTNAYDNSLTSLGNNAGGVGFLMPYWDDLNGGGSVTYYQTSGSSPNRIFTFQWGTPSSQWGTWGGSGSATFQVKLYESSGVIQFAYSAGYSYSSGTIGIANGTSDLAILPDETSSTPAGYFNTDSWNSPAANTLMTWAPPPTILVNPSSLTYTTLYSTTSPSQTVTLTGYGFTGPNVTVTPPANFLVYNGSSYVSTAINIPVSNAAVGTYINATVPVEFVAPATTGTYTGNLAFSTSGATTTNVPLTGNSVNPCNGTPTSGTASVLPVTGGGATPFVLSVTGYTLAAAISFQWQWSSDNSSWTDITGATNPTYNFTGITANTYYRVKVTCDNTASSVFSASTLATFIPTPTCVGTAMSWAYGGAYESGSYYYGVGQFTVTAAAGPNLDDPNIMSDVNYSTGYLSRTSSMTPVILYQGGTYPAAANFDAVSNFQEAQVWIDFNNDGTFQVSEEVSPVTGFSTGSTPNPNNFNITIPASAPTGTHLMRVRGNWEWISTSLFTTPAHLDPCASNYMGTNPEYFSGTIVDYFVSIQTPPPALTAAPTSLTFPATTTSTYSGTQTITLNGSYFVPASGNLTVTTSSSLFEISPDNSTWYTSSYNISYTGGGLSSPQTVYVRFKPLAVSSYSGNITISGGGLSPVVVVPVSGVGATLCAGSPTAGTAMITPGSGAGATAFTLSASGYTIAGGINFQWQSSPDNSAWTDITGATLATYNFTGVGADTYYRLKVTCSATSTSVYTTGVMVTFTPIPSCVGSGSSWAYSGAYESGNYYYGVGTFTVAAATGSDLNDASILYDVDVSTGYLSRTSSIAPVTLYQGGSYPAVANFGYASSFQEAQVWIDFNNDGVFQTSEEVSPVTGFSTGFTPDPNTFNITIPAAANTGLHLMRVRGNWEWISTSLFSVPPHLDPCANNYMGSNPTYFSGTIIDYYVNIQVPPPAASATPASLDFPATNVGVYAGMQSFVLNGSYLVPASGNITVTSPSSQFEVSPDNSTWYTTSYNISYTGATLSPAPTVYVRFKPTAIASYSGNITISGGGLSPVVNVPVTGIGAAPCSGSPTAGTASAAPMGGNAATAFTLSLSGYTVAGGITFQWQWSSNGTSGWTDITGATLATYHFSGLSATTYYRCNVTCGASTTPSSVTNIGYVPDPACTPTLYSWTYEPGNAMYGINAFSITGYSGSTLSDAGMAIAADANTGYLSRTSMTPVNLQQLGVYPASATWGYNSSAQELQVWIDFDNNGTFEVTEEVSPVSGYDPGYTYNPTNFDITIPENANPGVHLMRIRGIWETFSSGIGLSAHLDPCYINFGGSSPDYYSGDVVDYWVNIVALPACSGTPTAGTVSGTATSGCGTSYVTTLNTTGTTVGYSGFAYQWQTSPDNVTFTDITGATNTTYTATVTSNLYYRKNIGCTYSGITSSTPGQLISIAPYPNAITGANSVCLGGTATVIETSAGGTWSSSNTSIATIGSGSGIMSGVSEGTANISFTQASGCSAVAQITVKPLPSATTISPSSSATICLNSSATFNASSSYPGNVLVLNQDFNSGLGPWTIDNTGATNFNAIAPWQLHPDGFLSPEFDEYHSPDNSQFVSTNADYNGSGVTVSSRLISPTFSLANMASATLTFDHFYQSYSGDNTVAVEISTDGGSTWNIAQNYTYSGTGAPWYFTPTAVDLSAYLGQSNVKLRWNYISTYGYYWAIDNINVSGAPSVSFAWTGVGAATGLSCSNCNNPTITPAATGNNVYSVVATANGCSSTAASVNVSVNPIPSPITGPTSVCTGATVTMGTISTGGTWSSSSGNVSVSGATGAVTGVSIGTANITYAFSTGCNRVTTITINASPAAISGTASVCNGFTSTLTDATSSGLWSSSNVGIASVNGIGVVMGNALGNAYITYTTMNGCFATQQVSVNVQPVANSGTPMVCQGSTSVLTNATGGGVWSSASSNVAVSGGTVSGITLGTALVSYTIGSCSSTSIVTVNPSPSSIGGTMSVCEGGSVMLSNSVPGGAWTASNGNATVNAIGSLSGVAAGNTNITYTLSGGCYATREATINPAPTTITGTPVVCVNAITTLSNGIGGGVWTSGTGGVASAGASGDITGVGAGNATITYTLPAGCYATAVVTVNALPAAFDVTGGGGNCAGANGVHIGLGASATGVTYTVYNGGIAASGGTAGTNAALDFGLFTDDGVYTVAAVDGGTGCANVMTGSATVYTNPLPTQYTVTGGGQFCVGAGGVVAGMDVTDPGINYTIYLGGTAIATVPGTGYDISFGALTASGNYTVLATDMVTNCSEVMFGSAPVTANPLPIAYNVTGGGHFCSSESGVDVSLDNSEAGISYMLMHGSSVEATVVSTGGGFSFGNQTVGGAYTVQAMNTGTGCGEAMNGIAEVTVDMSPLNYFVTGGGTYCQGGSGRIVGLSGSNTGVNYILYRDGSNVTTLPGNGLALEFGSMTSAGVYTVSAVDAANGCITNMSGTAPVGVNDLPVAHLVSGSGSYCQGGTGLHVTLDLADNNISYQLYNGTSAAGSAIVGSGTPIDFGAQTAAGTYSVEGTNLTTGCKNAMTNMATIAVNPLPLPQTVTGGGSYCNGTGGVHIGTSSQVGVNYQLYMGSLPVGGIVAGTGSDVDFGLYTLAGVYTVLATDASSFCTSAVTGSATVTVNQQPIVYAVTGSSSYCVGGNGVHVILTGSDLGITYQLYLGSTPVGSLVNGTSTMLDFGLQTGVGTYSVIANPSSTCTTPMSSSAVITTTPLPTGYTVTGGGSYCNGGTGVHVGLDNTTSGVNYQLYSGSTPIGSTILSLAGGALDFGLITAAGSYSVRATDGLGCMNGMTGSASVTVTPLVTPSVTITPSATSVCVGNNVSFTTTVTGGGTTPSFHWMIGSTAAGIDSAGFTYTPADGDMVNVSVTSSAACATGPATASVPMTVVDNVTPSVTITNDKGTEVCISTPVTFTATPMFPGSAPTYKWIKSDGASSAVVSTGLTYTYMPVDGDIIYFIENSSLACVTVSEAYSNTMLMTVDSPYVPAVTIVANPGQYIKEGTSDTLVAMVTGGGPAPTYQWYIGTAAVTGATNSTFVSATLHNGDSVSCDVKGSGVCGLHGFNALIIHTTPVGVVNVSSGVADVQLLPNPNKGDFFVRGSLGVATDEDVYMELTDMLGQVVYRNNIVAKHGSIDEHIKLSSQLANGMYMLSLKSGSEHKVFHMVLEQ